MEMLNARNESTSGLTPCGDPGRDRWPEFELELRQRRPRRFHFDTCNHDGERRGWEWMVWRCRTWTEVSRVLNKHRVDWERSQGQIRIDGMTINRLS
jgi:hypothetical protein